MSGDVGTADGFRVMRVTDEPMDGGPAVVWDSASEAANFSGDSSGSDGPVLVTIDAPIQEGDQFRIAYEPGECGSEYDFQPSQIGTDVITVGPPADLPTELGSLNVTTGEGDFELQDSSCIDRIWRAYATLEVELTAGARPFADMFMYRLQVDGQMMVNHYFRQERTEDGAGWTSPLGGRWGDGNKVLVTASCNKTKTLDDQWLDLPLKSGTYSIALVATLPDGTELTSEATTVTLACTLPICDGSDSTPCREGDAGPQFLPDGGDILEPPDTATSDAGSTSSTEPQATSEPHSVDASASSAPDAGDASKPVPDESTDASTGAEGADAGEETQAIDTGVVKSQDGCSCTVGATSSGRSAYAWAGLLVGLSLWRRRERVTARE